MANEADGGVLLKVLFVISLSRHYCTACNEATARAID